MFLLGVLVGIIAIIDLAAIAGYILATKEHNQKGRADGRGRGTRMSDRLSTEEMGLLRDITDVCEKTGLNLAYCTEGPRMATLARQGYIRLLKRYDHPLCGVFYLVKLLRPIRGLDRLEEASEEIR